MDPQTYINISPTGDKFIDANLYHSSAIIKKTKNISGVLYYTIRIFMEMDHSQQSEADYINPLQPEYKEEMSDLDIDSENEPSDWYRESDTSDDPPDPN